jgi:hypothetical protein
MGLFSRLFGGDKQAGPRDEPVEAPEPPPDLVVVLRRGMNVPSAEYVDQVLAGLFPAGLPETCQRIALSQPSWYKSEEIADSIAAEVAATFGGKLGLDAPAHRRRTVDGPEGALVMVVELRRA